MDIRIDVAGAVELRNKVRSLATDQMPYAISRAVNETAYYARDKMIAQTRSAFTIRRPWVATGWRVIPSRKTDEPKVATLYLDPSRDMLVKFERGGTKVAISGGSLAVPEEARTGKKGLIPDRYAIRNLHLVAYRTKGGKVQLKGANRTFTMKGMANTVIAQRTGPGLGDYKILYVFKRSVPIAPRLAFYATTRQAITLAWPQMLAFGMAEAIRTAK